MAFDYLQTAQDAAEAILDVGALITLSWVVPVVYDPANPAAAANPPISVTAAGVVLPYASNKIGTQPDSLIRAGDQQLLLAALDAAGAPITEAPPVDALAYLADGTTWKVKNPVALAPAGSVVLFDITLRR